MAPFMDILSERMCKMVRSVLILVIVFLFTAHTEVNGTFPYIHIAYPVRGLVVIVGCLLLAYYTNQIKF